mgnify:CR=1 FL=1
MTSTILRININDADGSDDSSSSDDGHGHGKHEKHHKSGNKKHSHSKDHGVKLKFLEINMMGATIELETIKEGFKAIKDRKGNVTDTDHRFVYIVKGYGEGVGIDLIFNKGVMKALEESSTRYSKIVQNYFLLAITSKSAFFCCSLHILLNFI